MPDNKHLARREGGRTWYAVLAVPRSLRKAVGRANLRKSLDTTDIHVARARRYGALAEFHARLEEARRSVARHDGVTQAALSWRGTFAAIDRRDPGTLLGFGDGRPDDLDAPSWAEFTADAVLEDEADDIEAEHGAAAAADFRGIARGTATPLLLHVEAWLGEGGSKGPLAPRTAAQYRADMKGLETWLHRQGVTTLEGVSKALAGRWIGETMVRTGEHPATSNRRITAAASYWKWLAKRGHAGGENPWAGQSRAKGGQADHRTGERAKRPFTPDEVKALLDGPASPELADAMRVAALSGMRLEEIYRLTVADCADGMFAVRISKTSAGRRRVPIHSGLAEVVARRCAEKRPDAFLFHEAGGRRAMTGQRSAAASQVFGRYRQMVGVHDRAEGVRHSRVDFHSWRRWFATAALNAGIAREVVGAVLGHTAQDQTVGVYHGGFSDDRLRECVGAVRLPG